MKESDFKLKNFTVKVFLDVPFARKEDELLGFVSTAVKDLKMFDGPPTVLPIPADAPPEFPRAILTDKDNSQQLVILGNEIDYNFRFARDDLTFREKEADIFRDTETVFKYLSQKARLKDFKNVSVFASFFVPLEKSSVDLIRKHFLMKKKTDDLYSAQVNLVRKLRKDNVQFLKKLNLRSLRKTQDLSDDRAMRCDIEITSDFRDFAEKKLSPKNIAGAKDVLSKSIKELPAIFDERH